MSSMREGWTGVDLTEEEELQRLAEKRDDRTLGPSERLKIHGEDGGQIWKATMVNGRRKARSRGQ